MKSILFASIFTGVFGGFYWKFKQILYKPPATGIEPTNEEIRKSPEYQAWRKAVLKRDGYMCVWCRSTKNLEVDHVYPFAYFPELRFDIKNGRTLCQPCHKQTITYGSNAKIFYQRIINAK